MRKSRGNAQSILMAVICRCAVFTAQQPRIRLLKRTDLPGRVVWDRVCQRKKYILALAFIESSQSHTQNRLLCFQRPVFKLVKRLRHKIFVT